MELELWADLSQAICDVRRGLAPRPRDTHPTATIARVYLWAALHDRPTVWACDPDHWTSRTRPAAGLPDQSTMSRRMRRADFDAFFTLLETRLRGRPAAEMVGRLLAVRVVDGKPLELPNHTTDRNAAWGRGASRTAVGYKLHAIWSAGAALPDAFVVTSLDVCEKRMASRMIPRVGGVCGYLLGDGHLDASWLFDACRQYGHQLLCPRAKPGTGLGHHYVSPDRRRAIDLLEPPAGINPFGPTLHATRDGIERRFGNLTGFGGGLAALPPWVRRIWRVRRWVSAKLLINAARIRRLNRRRRETAGRGEGVHA
jgi:hypothetical protein